MNEGQIVIIAICAIGMSYRAYKLGIQAGIDRYVEYCRELANKHNGKILMQFYGQDIHFLDPMTQSKLEDDERP